MSIKSTRLFAAKNLKLVLTISTLILLGIAGLMYWRYLEIYPSTDNAYIQANIINIAAQVDGKISQVAVKNNQAVRKGQLLFTIDPSSYQLLANKARAELELDQKNAERIITLVSEGRASKAEGDAAKAKLAVSKANLAQAELNLQYTQVLAPANGIITNLSLREGTIIGAGKPLFALIESDNWWVDANYKETQLTRITPGQSAKVKLDMYPKYTLQGKVESISDGSGSIFSLLPPENATGNWVKVSQRFTVRIKLSNLDPAFPLRVGASSTVTINTKK